jgi:competence protein ComGC
MQRRVSLYTFIYMHTLCVYTFVCLLLLIFIAVYLLVTLNGIIKAARELHNRGAELIPFGVRAALLSSGKC